MSPHDQFPSDEYPLTDAEATEIATEAYVYASAIVQMEVHRRVLTNQDVSDGKQMRGPMNQFYHLREFPDASIREVVGPNFDTLYSFLWYDVSEEPLVISLPESTGHYYLMPIIDAWTDVFASPGTRTTGPGAFTFAIVGPDWRGTLPEGVEKIQSPPAFGWLPGRTRASHDTIAEVNAFQDQLRAVPLSEWGRPYTPPAGIIDPDIVMEPAPAQQVRAPLRAADHARDLVVAPRRRAAERVQLHPVLEIVDHRVVVEYVAVDRSGHRRTTTETVTFGRSLPAHRPERPIDVVDQGLRHVVARQPGEVVLVAALVLDLVHPGPACVQPVRRPQEVLFDRDDVADGSVVDSLDSLPIAGMEATLETGDH